jgi:hypothetical protein
VPDLLVRRVGIRRDERGCRDDLPRRAEAALERVGADEGIDERVLLQPLDRRHLALADRVHERDAAQNRDTVELDGAGAAMALAAGDLRPRQAEIVAQRLRERPPDRRRELVRLPVDAELRQPTSPP